MSLLHDRMNHSAFRGRPPTDTYTVTAPNDRSASVHRATRATEHPGRGLLRAARLTKPHREPHLPEHVRHAVTLVACSHGLNPMLSQEPGDAGVVRPLRRGVVETAPADVELPPVVRSQSTLTVANRDPVRPTSAQVEQALDGNGNTDDHLGILGHQQTVAIMIAPSVQAGDVAERRMTGGLLEAPPRPRRACGHGDRTARAGSAKRCDPETRASGRPGGSPQGNAL